MGAVFALFAGYYYWSPKILGYDYNELLGQIQFWIMFIGVNVTFFPQHFLGISGIPRRYADYADGYTPWNYVSSLGSIISIVGLLLFFYVVYDQLASRNYTSITIWKSVDYMLSVMVWLKNMRSSRTLEWELDNPAKSHSYDQIPMTSSENGNYYGNLQGYRSSLVSV